MNIIIYALIVFRNIKKNNTLFVNRGMLHLKIF